MITPSYSLAATERVLPRLALDFTTAALDPRVTFTRTGNTATVTNSSGVIASINADLPRFDYNPSTLVCRGLLIEEARTNVLLNSLLDGTSLATQTVVVTAAARTLSFYGTGQIVLSGAHSATVIGTGAYPTRTTLTFTPSAGALILTVTGTVQFAQLELGSFVTSFIPTAASQVTRTADVATMTSTNFSSWFNATEGSFVVQTIPMTSNSDIARGITVASDASNLMALWKNTSGNATARITTLGSNVMSENMSAWTSGSKVALTYKLNSSVAAINGGAAFADNAVTIPTVSTLYLGASNSATQFVNGHLVGLRYWPQRLTDTETRSFSK
jgi:hypothetical protein